MNIPLDTINTNLETDSKSILEESRITIQTHDKRFHVDDVGAVSLLTSYFNQKDTKVNLIRSRDLSLKSDILIDVGGIYDPENGRFDHHQKDCNETYSNKTTIPLSSIGMIWKHYGKEILTMFIESNQYSIEVDDDLCFDVYKKTIEEIDAHDNGIITVENSNIQSNMNISSIISSMNSQDTNDEDAQIQAFEEAVNLFGRIFEIKLRDIIRKYYGFKINHEIVKKYLENSNDEYLIINEKLDSIYKSLNILDPLCRIKFLIFNDNSEEITIKTRFEYNNFYVPLIPISSEEILKKELGDELIFVHKGLFIAKTKTLESAIKLVNISMKNRIISENVPSSYLKVEVSRTSGDWIKFGILSSLIISGATLSGMLLYKTYSN